MPVQTRLDLGNIELAPDERRRIDHHLDSLGRRLANHSDPLITVALTAHPTLRRYQVDLRVRLGSLGPHLVSSRRSAEKAGQAVRLAVRGVEHQLERRHASQRGEASFGVPSRRLPRQTRPSNLAAAEAAEED